ncbi:hypothetical protein UCMB321_4552 [Pseudomonas batumici]|uniref:Uncharacterized protein n=1 Tax=Pseudomonas batumici TaxID=226910 RepID=A0A0C2E7L3_9PSED|nr:hypothetical protein UCMB321_4552 [Pseudomonas batumici]
MHTGQFSHGRLLLKGCYRRADVRRLAVKSTVMKTFCRNFVEKTRP